MGKFFDNHLKTRAALRAAALVALFALSCASAPAQHEGHDMNDMPGMKHPAPKPNAKSRKSKKATARRSKSRLKSKRSPSHTPKAAAPTAAPPEHQHDHSQHNQPATTKQEAAPQTNEAAPQMHDAMPPDHSQHGQHMAMPSQSDKATQTQPGATPAPASAPADHNMPADHSMPAGHSMPADQSTHAGHAGMARGAEASRPVEASKPSDDASKPADDKGGAHDSMGGMDHSMGGMDHSGHAAGAGEMAHGAGEDASGLMVMSGDAMGVRVGASASNVMPMGQMGSGTAWQPASTPMYMWHRQSGDWLLMLHGEAKLGVNRQGGPRGVTKFESQNWLMPMAFRRVGRGTLQLRGMFSLEPLTFSGAGSPQIFQTGESYRGQKLVDFQHPHDLFMELSATYTVPVGERATWYAYLGFPGEPALGPVAFMHRSSASENPSAPLAHHLQDSTHISYGVFTTGFTYRWLKAEGSLFNGREPDEHRYNFEFNPWNSRSLRVTVAPNANWAVQYSYGFLKHPEELEPGDTHRQTASVQYNRPFDRGNLATTLIWGRNRSGHGEGVAHLNGYTAEATVNFLDKNYAYTRLELVDRDELLSHAEIQGLGFGVDARPQFRIGAYTFGGSRDVWDTDEWSIALGGDFTFYSKPASLDALYGRSPTSYKLFLRIRPGRMKHEEGAAHAGHGGD